ncbi:LCP family protein [Antrihabitans stalactiti]|uniref:LCP family protein n=1 Tax=Antrihabitans stalactiti TaxID=2584121 RepID=UPI0030B85051
MNGDVPNEPPRRPVPPRRPGQPPVEPEETQFLRRPPGDRGPQQAWSQAPPPPSVAPRRPEPTYDRPQYAPPQQPRPYSERPAAYSTPPPPAPPRRRSEPPPPARPRKPRKRKSGWRWVRRLIYTPFILLLILAIALFFGGRYLDGQLTRIDALVDYPGRVADTPGTNWLLVGSDSRSGLTPEEEQALATGGDTGPERTDTIIVVHIPKSGRTTMVSIPRDSFLPIPGNGQDKVNASFAIGGPQLLVQTLENATGLHFDHYAQIGFDGFAGLVDSIGGIDVCIDAPIDDPLAGINLQPGCQKLNGATALGFVRTRATANADLDRVQNQRKFLSALIDKATSPSSLLNPFKLWPFAKGTVKSLKVDKGDHIWQLAALGWAMRGDVITTTVPVDAAEDTYDSGNVLPWDHDRAVQFFDALAKDQQIPGSLLTPAR